MCGIVGVAMLPGYGDMQRINTIRKIFTECLVFNEQRGKDAAGVAVIKKNGSLAIYKRPISVSRLVMTKEYKEIMSIVNQDTIAILGHTRKPTKGSPNNNFNNHPIQVGSVIGVHNGIIENDDDIFNRFHLQRQAEVDSEAIFALIKYSLEENSKQMLSQEEISTRILANFKFLSGTYAFIAVDTRYPSYIIVGKYMRPLSVHYNENLKAFFFSSRYLFLRRAFGKAVLTEALKHRMLYVYDIENGIPLVRPFL